MTTMSASAVGKMGVDLVVGWSMKQEKKRIIVEYDCFHALLASKDELASKKTTFKAGESIGISGLWTFYLKLEREDLKDYGTNLDSCTNVVSAYFVLDPSSKELPGAPSTIMAEAKIVIVASGDKKVLAKKSSDFATDPFKEFGIQNAYTVPSDYSGLTFLEIPERIQVIIEICLYADGAVCSVKEQTERAGEFVQDLVEDFGKALKTGKASDVLLVVPKCKGSLQFHVRQAHKLILATRSPVFERIFSTENGKMEWKNKEYFIKDMSPRGLDILLMFIYTGKILPEWPEVVEDLVNAAEKYQLPKLKKFLDENLISICKVDNAVQLHKLAKKFGLSKGQIDIAEFARKDSVIFNRIFGNI